MAQVRSADGTIIAYERSGTGPPLVAVHGALGDHRAWFAVLPFLTPHFTVYAVDRRGRGASGDSAQYDTEREVEDLVAVLEAIGEPVALFGHSSGAVLSLVAAQRVGTVRHLILYEPPIPVDERSVRPPGDIQARLGALLAAGQRDEMVRIVMRLTMQASEAEIDAMQANPGWPYLLSLAHTTPYDMAIWARPFASQDVAALRVPTLLLIGAVTLPWLRASSETIAAILPDSRIALMPGQDHMAILSAPELVAREVLDFVRAADG